VTRLNGRVTGNCLSASVVLGAVEAPVLDEVDAPAVDASAHGSVDATVPCLAPVDAAALDLRALART
jgi:hypothetical protein